MTQCMVFICQHQQRRFHQVGLILLCLHPNTAMGIPDPMWWAELRELNYVMLIGCHGNVLCTSS